MQGGRYPPAEIGFVSHNRPPANWLCLYHWPLGAGRRCEIGFVWRALPSAGAVPHATPLPKYSIPPKFGFVLHNCSRYPTANWVCLAQSAPADPPARSRLGLFGAKGMTSHYCDKKNNKTKVGSAAKNSRRRKRQADALGHSLQTAAAPMAALLYGRRSPVPVCYAKNHIPAEIFPRGRSEAAMLPPIPPYQHLYPKPDPRERPQLAAWLATKEPGGERYCGSSEARRIARWPWIAASGNGKIRGDEGEVV
jgi:hypothetical protein